MLKSLEPTSNKAEVPVRFRFWDVRVTNAKLEVQSLENRKVKSGVQGTVNLEEQINEFISLSGAYV